MESNFNSSEDAPLTQQNEKRALDDVLSALKFGTFQIKMLILTCGAYFSACAEMMLIVYLSGPIKHEWKLNDMIFPVLPFCSGIVCLSGSYIAGIVSDKFGRQKSLLASLFIVSLCGGTSSLAPNFWIFVVLRSLTAFGTSGIETVDFVLILECLPREKRGTTMVVITLCGALGALSTAGFAWALLPRYGWRVFVGACAAPSCIILLYRLWCNYESPRYLYISGKKEEGKSLLVDIARQNGTKLPEGDILCPETQRRGRIQELFSPSLRLQTIFTALVWFLQSMGFWSVTMYLPEYMSSIDIDPYFNMFAVFIGEIPGLCLAMYLIEHRWFGRIRCLRMFSLASIICLVIFALINVTIVKTIFVILVYFFMVPIYSILNTYTPEVYPTDTRSIAMALMCMIVALPSVITAFIGATVLSTDITWLYPIVAAGFFSLQFLFTWGLKSETAGQDLHDTKTSREVINNTSVNDESILCNGGTHTTNDDSI
ncbi:hypothetical protein ACF0H5_016412 [Mactra antiquata]